MLIRKSLLALVVTLSFGTVSSYAQQTRADEVFTLDDLIKGTTSTKEKCAATPSTVWVEVEGRGDCIRYYAAGLKDENRIAIVYLHGGRLFGTADPNRAGQDAAAQAKLRAIIADGYQDNTAAAQREQVRWIQSGLDVPFIKIARPGVYGSSGDHKVRIQEREERLIAAAIDAIVEKHKIASVAVTGNSEGGNIAAYLVTKMPKLKCAVLTSAAVSLDEILRIDPTSGYKNSPNVYDPIKHISEIPKSDSRRIFVIGNPTDKIAPLSNQKAYFDAINAAGVPAWFAATPTAAGGSGHTLDRTGMHVGKWCLEDVSSDEIMKRIAAGALRG